MAVSFSVIENQSKLISFCQTIVVGLTLGSHCSLGAMDISSPAGTHLKAHAAKTVAISTASEIGHYPKVMLSATGLESASQAADLGHNWAQLDTGIVEQGPYLTHPGIGDCVIHLGVVPAPGSLVITR